MHLSFFVAVLAGCASLAVAVPRAVPFGEITARSTSCTNPSVRVDFNTLTTAQRTAYFKAVNCLIKLPASPATAWAQSSSRYDDLVATHYFHANLTAGTDNWHHVGQFLHIHRAYLHAFESMLRNECSYKGPMSYWPEQKDAGHFTTSTVVAAFGGPGPGLITTGPFANKDAPYGPLPNTNGWSTTTPPSVQNLDHTLWRNVTEGYSAYANVTEVKAVFASTDFGSFKTLLYNTLHTAGHFGLGGDMGHPMASPNDPLFFMHHMYLDARWWQWQQANPSVRTYQIPTPGPGMYTTQSGTTNMTLATILDTVGLVPNMTVADAANTQGGCLCYVYSGLSAAV